MKSAGQPCQSHAQRQVLSLQELRQHIAPFLGLSDLLACCQVSKQWHQDWNPFLWKNVNKKVPQDFSRYGHLVKNLHLRMSSYPVTSGGVAASIRDSCLNMRSVSLTHYGWTLPQFENGVLGIPSASPLSLPAAKQDMSIEAVRQVQVNSFYSPPERNGFLSNSLHSLSLCMPPLVCDVILPRLTQARMAGSLQGLRSFTMYQAILYYTCIDVEVTPPCILKISTVFEFLDTFPELTSFSTADISIMNDTYQAVQSQQIREHVYIVKLDISPATDREFELLATKIPHVVDLSIRPRGSSNLLPIIQQHYPGLTSFACRTRDHIDACIIVDDNNLETQKNKFKDWVQLLRGLSNLERFTACAVLPFIVLESLALFCPKLEFFKANDEFVSLRGVRFMLQHSTALKHLVIPETAWQADFFKDDGLPWKAPLETLHVDHVGLHNDGESEDSFRNRIRQLTRLRSLRIAYAGTMTARSFLDEDDLRSAAAEKRYFVPKVKETEEWSDDDDDDWNDSVSNCRTWIDSVNIVGDTDESESGDFTLIPHYPCLEELTLRYFPKVSVEGTHWRMMDIMPRLRSLRMDKTFRKMDILKMRGIA